MTTHFPLLILAGRQIAADQNLLRAGGQIGQPVGIHGRHFQAAEFDVQIAEARLRDFVEPFEGDGLRRLHRRRSSGPSRRRAPRSP